MQKIVLVFLIVLLSACSPTKPGVEPLFVIYPYDFYEKFNLRTIISSYAKHLQSYCASYPKDIFPEHEIRVANSKFLVLDDGERRLTFEMVSFNQVIITDEVIASQYKAKSLYTFYYNEDEDDFRVNELYIEKNKNCIDQARGYFKVDSNKIIKK